MGTGSSGRARWRGQGLGSRACAGRQMVDGGRRPAMPRCAPPRPACPLGPWYEPDKLYSVHWTSTTRTHAQSRACSAVHQLDELVKIECRGTVEERHELVEGETPLQRRVAIRGAPARTTSKSAASQLAMVPLSRAALNHRN